jgi:hypothetical protein
MRRLTLALGTAAVIFAASVSARATDFSGKWTLDQAKTQAANAALNGVNPGTVGRVIVTQDAKTLTVLWDNATPRTYNLDGSDSINTVSSRGGQTSQVSTATWDGAKLKIVTKVVEGNATQIWSLEDGDLKIATTGPGVDGILPPTRMQVLRKSSEDRFHSHRRAWFTPRGGPRPDR